MSGRIQRLFARYAARHLRLRTAAPDLCDAAGRARLRNLRLALRDGWLVVEAEADPGTVVADLGGYRREVAAGGALRFSLPDDPGPLTLRWQGETAAETRFVPFGRLRRGLGRAALLPRFALAGAGALPAARRWFATHDMAARAEVKARLGLGAIEGEALIDPASLRPLPPQPAAPGVTVILPVYNAAHLLPEVLDRLARHTDLPWRAVLVEDASTDPTVRPLLHAWHGGLPAVQQARVQILEHSENKGFIASVNEGLLLARSWPDPVVLLNSDAFLPAGWASRLTAPLAAPDVASVTPLSNDAELCTVPVICAPAALAPGEGDALDRAAADWGALPAVAAPTGVGFCMAIARGWLERLPGFDPAFGRGYGEEVDWCQRIQAMGARHLCLPGLFVEHRGGQSFGSAAKAEALRRNGALVSSRHPRFDGDVQRFIAEDPLRGPRLALGLAWAGRRGGEVAVYLAHALGGGAEMDLERRIAADLAGAGAAVVLRVGGVARWRLELHTPQGVTAGATDDFALVRRLVSALPRRRIVYSCGVGDRDPASLPGHLLELAQGQPVEVLVHDYLPLSPSYTLLGRGGRFEGLPAADSPDPRHSARRPDGSTIGPGAWRALWGALVLAAREVTVFSDASARLVGAAWPGARVVLRPHLQLAQVPRLPAPAPGAPPVIGVLGHIAPQKGAAVLEGISRHLRRSRRARLVLLGRLDPGFQLVRPAVVHGGYALDDLPELVRRHGITCWLIPSTWPETFSFATHEALATGLPVWTFDLGAQADAVRAALTAGAPGGLVDLGEAADRPARVLRAMGLA